METKLKGLWEKVKNFFKNMSTKVRIILAAALTVILIAVVALVIWNSHRPYKTLFTNLTATEASEVLSYLQENGFNDYQYSGDTISVRAEQQPALLAQLALAGYPKNGSLYDYYTQNVGTMTTTSQAKTALLISVEEDLAAAIRTFKGVTDAYVKIAEGEDRVYVLEDVSTETSATVKVTMRDGYMLDSNQADAIRGMVSHAVAGLTIDNVFITDTVGNTYTSIGDPLTDIENSSALKFQREQYYNNLVRTAIKNQLDPIFGRDNVRVDVNTTIDLNRRYRESTYYAQPEGSAENAGLINKEEWLYQITRDGAQAVGGVPGTTSNSDIPIYVEDALQMSGNENYAGHSGDKDYSIDETHEQVEYLTGTITNITAAVTINANAPNANSVDYEELRQHVVTISNIGGEDPLEHVSVLVAPFAVEPAPEPGGFFTAEMVPYLIIAAAALLLLIIILIVVLSVRRKKRKKQEEEQRAIEEQLSMTTDEGGITPEAVEAVVAAAPPTGGADIMEVNTEKSMELRKNIRQFAQNNPELAAQMIKVWLKGESEEENGRRR